MIDRFCGNRGDAALPGVTFDFGGQRIFTLACIGCVDTRALEAELARLIVKHGINAPELKSKALTGKPQVAADIEHF